MPVRSPEGASHRALRSMTSVKIVGELKEAWSSYYTEDDIKHTCIGDPTRDPVDKAPGRDYPGRPTCEDW